MSSHIQVELDALNNAHTVAVSAGVGPEKIVYGLNMMWAFCFRSKVQHVSRAQLRGFFGTDSAIGPLEDFGFVVVDGDRFRVRGADRYRSVSEKRSAAGKIGREKQLADRANGHSDGQIANGQNRANAVLPTSARANAQHLPSDARANDSKSTVCPPVARQKRALYPRSDNSSLREEELSTHESPVAGPPQHAPGRGRAVAPPTPEPEPEPEWVPPPRCASGRHLILRLDKRCPDCEAEADAPILAAKKAAEEAEHARIAAIPMPPKPEHDPTLSDEVMLARLQLFLERSRARARGENWQESMPA